MARIRLDRPWTDAEGNHHRAGDAVEVDDETLAELRRTGVVAADVEADDGNADGNEERQAERAEPSADINDTDVL